MTITQAISNTQAVTGQVFDTATLRRWLSELDGQLAFEVYGVDTWTGYSAADDGALLLVPYPWDGLYVHHLEAMTYYSNGEYDRYQNALVMREMLLGEFKRFVQRTRTRCGEVTVQQAGDGGSAVTVIERGSDLWRYMSAYGTAVLHGFEGTPEEWLASLRGPQGSGGGLVMLDAGSGWAAAPSTPVPVTAAKLAEITAAIAAKEPVIIHWINTEGGHCHAFPSESGVVGGYVAIVTAPCEFEGRLVRINAVINPASLQATLSVTDEEPIWIGTQTQYDALSTYDPKKIYLITE